MEKEKTKDFAIKEKSQKRLKGISKFLYIIFNIFKVFAIIGIVGMVIAMACVPALTKNTKVSETDGQKIINVFDQEFYYKRSDDGFEFYEKGKEEEKTVFKNENEIEVANRIMRYLEKNDLSKIAIYIEVIFVLVIASLVIEVLIFKKAHEFFKNIYDEDTPFTKNNISLLKNIGKLLLYAILISFLSAIVVSYIFDTTTTIQVTNIVEILIVFFASYVFEYGYKLQNSTKGKIYSDAE